MSHFHGSQKLEVFDVTKKKICDSANYDLIIDYHPGKANVVVDALSQKSLLTLRALNIRLTLVDDSSILVELKAKPILYFRNKLCVPKSSEVKQKILQEAHSSSYSTDPSSYKMYGDLKQMYWWPGMKREISKSVSKCLICQQFKVEHLIPSRLLQHVMIPEWK
ncbi:integrase [Gossypium australe]|uniref:Integrase n=1 Tax=Gossypium australe TaxID=47621 RepID=A0A5B6VBK3_9ROSI|nr:integrase [Gossypium australe]